MSFDDGSLGRREGRTGPRGEGRTGISGLLVGVYSRLRTHVEEWPARYVEMRASRFERE